MPHTSCECDYCRRVVSPADRMKDKLVPEVEARQFLGGVSHMFMRRRAADPRFHFPTPKRLGRRRMYWLSDLAEWASSRHAELRTSGSFGQAA
ncbi:MAG: hypothetical protein JO001_28890 [Alphaproteobacteria bacterium]|nr:hypothetical protein [Alphaproteobacteria bacterium]